MQTLVEGCKGEKSPEEKLERLGLHLRDSYEVRMERNWEVIIYTPRKGFWGGGGACWALLKSELEGVFCGCEKEDFG